MKTFIIYWKSGEYELLRGTSIEDAVKSAGYGFGAIRAMDFYDQGTIVKYTWIDGAWVKDTE